MKIQSIIILSVLILMISKVANATFETIKFTAKDGLEITADIYITHPLNAPFILLFHQAGYSRGEYREIALQFNKLGFNAMALDQRSGNAINDVANQTAQQARVQNLPHQHLDALIDLEAAIAYVKKNYLKGKLIILGSSYSASLVLKIAGDTPDIADAVLAFSPAEYFSNKMLIQQSAVNIKIPTFITSAKSEQADWQPIFNAITISQKVSFLPTTAGRHGASVLWNKTPEHPEYWDAVKSFLKPFSNLSANCIATYFANEKKLAMPCVKTGNNSFDLELKQQDTGFSFNLITNSIKSFPQIIDQCQALYNTENGRLIVPCVAVEKEQFYVELQQQTEFLFDLDLGSIKK